MTGGDCHPARSRRIFHGRRKSRGAGKSEGDSATSLRSAQNDGEGRLRSVRNDGEERLRSARNGGEEGLCCARNESWTRWSLDKRVAGLI